MTDLFRASDLSERSLSGAPAAPISPHPERGVLLIEDDPDLQWSVARLLSGSFARVVGARSGEAALEVISRWPADLVLVDEGLPGMSGLDVARAIQRTHPSIPVVLMGNAECHELRLAARLAGVVDVLAKPFRLEGLRELLARLSRLAQDMREGLGPEPLASL